MFRKLKEMRDSPYLAPLTQPLKRIFAFAAAPLKNFGARVQHALNRNPETSLLFKLFKDLGEGGYSSKVKGHTRLIAFAGWVLGGIGAAGGAGLAASGAGAGVVGTIAAGAAALSAGVMLGPFVVAGLVGLCAAVVGAALFTVPGIIEGGHAALSHYRSRKARAALITAVPQMAAAPAEVQQKAIQIMKEIRQFPQATQGPLVKALQEQFAAGRGADVAGIFASVEALTEGDRKKLIRGLQVKLKDAFEAVAIEEANAGMALHKEVKVAGGPLKLRR